MPYIDLNRVAEADRDLPMSVHDGVFFAHSSVQFAALAISAERQTWSFPRDHLYALAIELGLKSLALRSGATLNQCRRANHNPEKMIQLIESCGTIVPQRLKTRLGDKDWFHAFLFMSRYPAISELNTSLETTIFRHSDYPQMIAEILEVNCRWPLSFERGCALDEVRDPPSSLLTARFKK